jgi:hypothetical protein
MIRPKGRIFFINRGPAARLYALITSGCYMNSFNMVAWYNDRALIYFVFAKSEMIVFTIVFSNRILKNENRRLL